jgi:translation initiation factor 2B subunit (eIF-2B alpha/beta/delta family)
MLPLEMRDELERIAADRTSGATSLVLKAVAVLRDASREPGMLAQAARTLCLGQPSMAGFRTASALALASADPVRTLDTLAERVRRAPPAIARIAAPVIRLRTTHGRALRVVTCSYSTIVERTLVELYRAEPLQVCCAESRPGREGVALAQSLLAAGCDVRLYSDAGIGSVLDDADAVLVGADAVAPSSFMNKAGTAAIAALARARGVPVFVVAGREKLLPATAYGALAIVSGASEEIAAELPEAAVRNPYFERVPIDLVSQVFVDSGALAPGAVEAATLWTSSVEAKYESIIIR